MNLIYTLNKLEKLNIKLNLESSRRSDGTYEIRNWMQLSNTLHELKSFSYLVNQVDSIFSIDDNINIRSDNWIAKNDTNAKLIDSLHTLRNSIQACVELITQYTEEDYKLSEGEGILNTKMPDKIDMQKMSKICDDLDKIFNQCPLIEDEINFIGVEKGSVYFVFIASYASITIIGKILNIALDIQRKYYENRMLKRKLDTMDNVGEAVEIILKNLENEVNEFVKGEASKIEEAKNLESEETERLIFTITTLSDLIGQGVQMQCELYEGEEKSDVTFPSVEEFKSLIDGMKMLK